MPRHGCESGQVGTTLYTIIYVHVDCKSRTLAGDPSARAGASPTWAPSPPRATPVPRPHSKPTMHHLHRPASAVRPSVGLVRHSRRGGAARNARAPPGRS